MPGLSILFNSVFRRGSLAGRLARRSYAAGRILAVEPLEPRQLLSLVDLVAPISDPGGGGQMGEAVSMDGRYVAFASRATSLVPGDTNGFEDVFVKDLQTRAITRVSRDIAGNQGNGDSYPQVGISGDGRYVVFASAATNLVPGDTNGYSDVFIKDLQTGAMSRVDTDSAGSQANSSVVNDEVISADGRFVAFTSPATNLVPGDTNGEYDVFIKDTQTGTTTRVSTDSNGNQAIGPLQSGALSLEPAISGDGRFVAFTSYAANLVPDGNVGSSEVFRKDLQTGATICVSTDATGNQANSYADFPLPGISANGRFVAVSSRATNLVPGVNAGTLEIFRKDLQTGAITCVSTDSDGNPGNLQSVSQAISADGRYVACESFATNLVSGDTNAKEDIFLKDVATGAIVRVSTDGNGSQGNGNSSHPAMSADGRFVVFASGSNNLIPGDTDNAVDVFRVMNPLVPPTVVYATASVQHVTQSNAQTDGLFVRVHYDPANDVDSMLLASRPTITFQADTPALTAEVNATLVPDWETWATPKDYIEFYNVVNTGAVVPNVDLLVAGAKGAYGIEQDSFLASGAFTIDMTTSAPLAQVQSAWGTVPLLTGEAASPHPDPLPQTGEGRVQPAAQTEPPYWVRVHYAQPMSNGIQPTVTLTGDTPADTANINATLHYSCGSWTSPQDYMAWYDVQPTDVPLTGVYLAAEGAHDLVGNVQAPYLSSSAVFKIDTHDPAPAVSDVTSLGSSMSSITAHEIGSQLYLEIVYLQTMDISSTPTIQFLDGAGNPTGVPGATVYQNYPASYWGSDHVYWAFFDIQNPYAGQDPPGIILRNVGVQITDARDITGRAQATYQELKIFDIDTLAADVASLPAAATVTPSLSVITEANTGAAKFYVRIDYDRPMWGGLAPEVSFVPDSNTADNITALNNTLTPFADYSGWGNYDPASHGYTTYWQWYSVTDVNARIPFVGIEVKGAVDTAGHPQSWHEWDAVFSIAMRDDASPLSDVGRIANPSQTDAALAAAAFHSATVLSPTAAIIPADYALLYSGTWLEA